ncbi:MAG: hypothetical protein JWP74_3491 [Marmoricola sp.]|nr:hypothetical protein [Marmoricola sp.]
MAHMTNEPGRTDRKCAVTLNGRTSMELKVLPTREPVEQEIAGYLDRLNGSTRYSINLWELPPATTFERVNRKHWPEHYIQAAGSRDRMTVEIRIPDQRAHKHFVVRKSDTIAPSPTEEIRWDTYSTLVYDVEVFTAAEAVPLFLSYWQTGDIASQYRRRELDMQNQDLD